MNMKKTEITREIAEKEVEGWLDYKNIRKRKREELKDSINSLVDAVEDGLMIIDQKSFVVTQKLLIPIENSEGVATVTELKLAPRINAKLIREKMKGVKSDDLHGMMISYIAALSGNAKEIIGALDTVDYGISNSFSSFFM